MSQQYTLTVDIATIDSLGRNLYSNAAAVLSEFVANAWDADANKVEIEYVPEESSGLIRITDDGCGMTENELNSRFLTVGYNKRNHEGDVSWKFKRPYMGRKGIGKLSAFSLADKMVVSSKKKAAMMLTDSRLTLMRWRRRLPVPTLKIGYIIRFHSNEMRWGLRKTSMGRESFSPIYAKKE